MKKKRTKNQIAEDNMNKLSLYISILALIASCVTFFLSFSKSELVYVDINRLVEGYERTKVERKAFSKKTNTMKANVDSLMVDWQTELKSYEKERLSMTKKELDLKQELLQTKQQQINNYQQAIQKQIQEEDKKMTQTVLNDINGFVSDYGKEHGYKIILGAKGDGNIMYAQDASDLTQAILHQLNNQYQGK
ncbi:MAG: OmpH family outer membrane protein [Allomuricauda sp.]